MTFARENQGSPGIIHGGHHVRLCEYSVYDPVDGVAPCATSRRDVLKVLHCNRCCDTQNACRHKNNGEFHVCFIPVDTHIVRQGYILFIHWFNHDE